MKDLSEAPNAASPFDLLTIGHSNHPIERFLALVKDAGVTAIADVRSQPVSRRYPWFSAGRLGLELAREGIAYLPMGEGLGGRPRDPSLLRDGIADYEAMAKTPAFRAGIAQLVTESKRFRVCVMCAEREPLDCHRCLLIAPALQGLALGHILADGSIVGHDVIERRLLDAAGENLFTDPAERLAQAYRRRARAVAYRARA
jgi:uncharacterized protein (DUF488 family)